MRKVLIIVYFCLDILAPLLVSASFGTAAGAVTILLSAVYGYVLIRSFPTDQSAVRKQFIGLAIALSSIVFGVAEWAAQSVAGLALGLGLALCLAIIKLDNTSISRMVALVFGLPLIVLGAWWIWQLNPSESAWPLLGWFGWAYGSISYSYHRYRTVKNYFKQYYTSARQRGAL